ncbi:MAG: GFA family protein [Sandaracinaceae bacterium]
MSDKRQYDARCHCGALRFGFRSEPLTEARRCNCSMCVRKGAVMSAQYIPAEDFDPIPEGTDMADYRWGDHDVNHLFCRTCGIYPYHGDASFGYRVNLGCVEGLDVLSLPITVIDGRAM